VLLSLLAAILAFQTGPSIHQIRVVGDTVWFEGDRDRDGVQVRYCFARRTGAWCSAPRSGQVATPSARIPRGLSDSVELAPDLALVCRPPVPTMADCETFAVRAGGDTSLYPLVPRANSAALAMLQRAAGLETEEPLSMSEFVTAWAAGDDAIWFGLGGGFPEGYGAYGGLLRFDRARRTVETVVHAGLAGATVSGLAIDGDTLWVGTLHPAEYGPVGSTGILCRNLRTGQWTALDPAGAWLPDKVVQSIAARDGALFIATREGLAVYDTRTGRWSVRYFSPTTIDGTAGYVLAERRPSAIWPR
jgi:hypothetical protein